MNFLFVFFTNFKLLVVVASLSFFSWLFDAVAAGGSWRSYFVAKKSTLYILTVVCLNVWVDVDGNKNRLLHSDFD